MKIRLFLATALAVLALASARQAHAVSCSPFVFIEGQTLPAASLNAALASAAELGSQCAGNGDTVSPGFSFASTPNTGLFLRNDGGIGAAVAGVEVSSFRSAGIAAPALLDPITGSIGAAITTSATIENGANTGLAQTYFGSGSYLVGPGFQASNNGRVQINGQGRGWERQTCMLTVQVFPAANNPNGCGQGNFYSFPIRWLYGGQDAEAVQFGANGIAPIASGVGISSITPVTIINAGGVQQLVYQVNFSSPLSGGQVSALQAIVAAPGGPPRVETNNLFFAYVATERNSSGTPLTTFPLVGGGTIPDVDPSGNFIVADCFVRAIPSDPEAPDPTAPVSPAPPTNYNACPIPTDFDFGLFALTNTATTASGNAVLNFRTTTSKIGASVVNGMNILGPTGTPVGATVSSHTSATVTMSAPATQDIIAGNSFAFTGHTVRAYATSPTASGASLTINNTTGISAGWHVWGYGVPYSDTVASVTDGTHLVLTSAVLSGGVPAGSSACTISGGTPGRGCLTFSAPGAALTLTIDAIHLADAIYAASNVTDADTLTNGSVLEMLIVNNQASAPAWGIDPLNDQPMFGGVIATTANGPASYAALALNGNKRGFVAENPPGAGVGTTYGFYAVNPSVAFYSLQPSGNILLLENQNGTSATNQVLMDTDGNLVLAGNVTASAFSYQVLSDRNATTASVSSGGTYTFSAGQSSVVLQAGGTLATFTVVLPSSPGNGQVVSFTSQQQITSLTVNAPGGATVVAPPTSLSSTWLTVTFKYVASITAWIHQTGT